MLQVNVYIKTAEISKLNPSVKIVTFVHTKMIRASTKHVLIQMILKSVANLDVFIIMKPVMISKNPN